MSPAGRRPVRTPRPFRAIASWANVERRPADKSRSSPWVAGHDDRRGDDSRSAACCLGNVGRFRRWASSRGPGNILIDSTNRRDSVTGIGDPPVGAFARAGRGATGEQSFRAWSTYRLGSSVPRFGDYEVGPHRRMFRGRTAGAYDIGGALYDGELKGRAASCPSVLGFTLQRQQRRTPGYNTGTEMHLGRGQAASAEPLVVSRRRGNWYGKLTADSNNPESRRPSKGRADCASVPELSYQFTRNPSSVTLDLRLVTTEFEVQEIGLEGRTSVFLTISLPLSITEADRRAGRGLDTAGEGNRPPRRDLSMDGRHSSDDQQGVIS